MAERQDIQPQIRKPFTLREKLEGRIDRLKGLKSKVLKDSVMEPGFIESLTAPEGSPIDYENISSVSGGRVREMFVDPMRRYGKAIHKGMSGEPISIKDQLDLIEGMIDTTIGGLFTHGVQKGGFDPNTLHMFVGPKAKDIVKAEKMVRRGASPAEIHKKLLMHKKPDGMWRKEISDEGLRVKEYVKTPMEAWEDLAKDTLTGKAVGMENTLSHLDRYKNLSADEVKNLVGKRHEGIQKALETGNVDMAKARRVMEEYRGIQSMDLAMRHKESGGLKDFIEHESLFEKYPQFNDLFTQRKMDLGGYGGTYTHGTEFTNPKLRIKEQAVRKDEAEIFSHELQHGVQGEEGWARGGNPEMMGNKLASLKRDMEFNTSVSALAREATASTGGNLDKAMKELNELGLEITQEHVDQVMRIGEKEAIKRGAESETALKEFVGGDNKTPMELYQNLLGEREARDTAARLGLNLEQRRHELPDVGEGAQVLMR